MRKLQRQAARRQGARPGVSNGPPRLDDEWRRWIAENLLQGATTEQIAQRLAANGAPPAVISAEIAAAQNSPYFRASALLQNRLAKRDWLLASYRKLEAVAGSGEVPRVANLPADRFFADYYAAHRPVVLTGLIDHWPAMSRWSLDYFAETLGDPELEVQTGRNADPSYEMRSNHHKGRMALSALSAKLSAQGSTNDFYVTANNGGHNRTALDPLWADIGTIDGYLDPKSDQDGFFWMGPRGTITPFHHDLTNNLLMQITGRKKVTLVPSWDTPLMRNSTHCFSDWQGPAEIAALPDGSRPALYECVIGPGDILFIPVGWWHHVEGLDMTIGLSFVNFTRDNDFYSNYSTYEAV